MDNTHKNSLLTTFQMYNSVSQLSLNRLIEVCEIKNYKKGDRLSEAAKTDLYEYFLIDSRACRYIFDEQGEIVVSGFYLPGAVVTPNFARTLNSKSVYNLEILTEGSVARIPVKIMDSLRNSYEDIRIFGSKVVEHELSKILYIEVSHRTSTAKKRLLTFRKDYHNFENLIPHSYIASYLGITPVSFSRIRNEITKE